MKKKQLTKKSVLLQSNCPALIKTFYGALSGVQNDEKKKAVRTPVFVEVFFFYSTLI